MDSINVNISNIPVLNYNITMLNRHGVVGTLDFNGDYLVFDGRAEESARIFIDWVSFYFSSRLDKERIEMKARCIALCNSVDKSTHPADLADMIRRLD